MTKALETFEAVNNDAEQAIALEAPYVAEVTIRGTTALLLHRWSCEAVMQKGREKKGSIAKKTDDVESYVYRNAAGEICLPGEYLRMSIVNAAKFLQDPRSPRKSAMDLFKAGIIPLDELCSLGSKDWEYLDRRRVTVQRSGITRQRPAFNSGWRVTCNFQVVLPEYIAPAMLNDAVQRAGRLVGVADFRPTYGRFQVTGFRTEV